MEEKRVLGIKVLECDTPGQHVRIVKSHWKLYVHWIVQECKEDVDELCVVLKYEFDRVRVRILLLLLLSIFQALAKHWRILGHDEAVNAIKPLLLRVYERTDN